MHRITRPRFKALGAGSLALVFGLGALVGSNVATASAATALPSQIGLSQLVAANSATAKVRGVAEFSSIPSASQVSALNALGLLVQPMKHLPLALVFGPGRRDAGRGHARRRRRTSIPDEPDPAARHRVVRRDGSAPPRRAPRASPARA